MFEETLEERPIAMPGKGIRTRGKNQYGWRGRTREDNAEMKTGPPRKKEDLPWKYLSIMPRRLPILETSVPKLPISFFCKLATAVFRPSLPQRRIHTGIADPRKKTSRKHQPCLSNVYVKTY